MQIEDIWDTTSNLDRSKSKVFAPACPVCGRSTVAEVSFKETVNTHINRGTWRQTPLENIANSVHSVLLYCGQCNFVADMSFFEEGIKHPELKGDNKGYYIELPSTRLVDMEVVTRVYIKPTTPHGKKYLTLLRVVNAKNVGELAEALAAYDDLLLQEYGKKRYAELKGEESGSR